MQIQKTSATASLLPILIKSFKSLMYPQVFMLFFVPLISFAADSVGYVDNGTMEEIQEDHLTLNFEDINVPIE